MWTEKKYTQICNICDEILNQDISISRVSISDLHVLNEHPVNLKKYEEIYYKNKNEKLTSVKKIIIKYIRLVNSYFSYIIAEREAETLKKTDVLIISHLLAESQLGANEDFYFGVLPEELAKQNLSCIVALHNHTGKNFKNIIKKWPKVNAARVLLKTILPLRIELKVRTLLKIESSRLKNLTSVSNTQELNSTLKFSANQAEASSTINTLGQYFQIKNLVETLRPRAIIVTYEGHAWERLAFAAAREVDKNIKCIAYQHAILFPRQHAIKRMLGHNYDPDVIITAGKITRDILRKAIQNPLIQINVGGTHRFKKNGSTNLNQKMAKEKGHCLVVPDGNQSECIKIIDFVFKSARLESNLKFIIRMHPLIVYEQLAKKFDRFKNPPANIEISTMSIDEDLLRCRWVLYRGSSAAIYAVIAGLRPFYLAEEGELNIDPLFSLEEWRQITKTPADLINKIKTDSAAEILNLEAEWENAREFCLNYFQPTDISQFVNVIKGIA
jgi:hypothetical protein